MNLTPSDLAKFEALPDGNLLVTLSRFGALTIKFPNGQCAQVYIARGQDKAFHAFFTTRTRGESKTYALTKKGEIASAASPQLPEFLASAVGLEAAAQPEPPDEQPEASGEQPPASAEVPELETANAS